MATALPTDVVATPSEPLSLDHDKRATELESKVQDMLGLAHNVELRELLWTITEANRVRAIAYSAASTEKADNFREHITAIVEIKYKLASRSLDKVRGHLLSCLEDLACEVGRLKGKSIRTSSLCDRGKASDVEEIINPMVAVSSQLPKSGQGEGSGSGSHSNHDRSHSNHDRSHSNHDRSHSDHDRSVQMVRTNLRKNEDRVTALEMSYEMKSKVTDELAQGMDSVRAQLHELLLKQEEGKSVSNILEISLGKIDELKDQIERICDTVDMMSNEIHKLKLCNGVNEGRILSLERRLDMQQVKEQLRRSSICADGWV